MESCVLLNSGGVDSRVLAAYLKSQDLWEIHSLFIDMVPASSEIRNKAAKITADTYCNSHVIFPYPFDWTKPETMQGIGIGWPGIFTAVVGLQYAHYLGAEWLFSGTRIEGRIGTFYDFIEPALNIASVRSDVTLSLPFYRYDFMKVDEIGKNLGVDFSTVYSCGYYPPCGTCSSCMRVKSNKYELIY